MRVKFQLDNAGRPVTVLFYHNIRDIFFFHGWIDSVFAVNKHHDIGILFNGAGFAEVGKPRPFVIPFVYFAGKLGKRQHRNIKFARHGLQPAGKFRDLLDNVVGIAARLHQLEIIYNDQA